MAHTPEFRREAVRLYRVGQRGIRPTAQQPGIAPGTLRVWVRRLDRKGLSKRAIARRLAMSRTTVYRLLALSEPPAHQREPAASLLDPFKGAVPFSVHGLLEESWVKPLRPTAQLQLAPCL